jgi:hypothetical protein
MQSSTAGWGLLDRPVKLGDDSELVGFNPNTLQGPCRFSPTMECSSQEYAGGAILQIGDEDQCRDVDRLTPDRAA